MNRDPWFSSWRARTYDKCAWHFDPVFAQWIVDHLLHYGTSICEIGAGTGHLLQPLTRVFDEITLIEPSSEMLTLLKRRVDECEGDVVGVCQGAAENIPLKDHSVEIALSKSALHHLSDRQRCIREMARIASKAIAVVEVISPVAVASDPVCLDYLRALLFRKEPTRSKDTVFSEEDISRLIAIVAPEQRLLHFDQYIDILTWLECGDLHQSEREQLHSLVETQSADIRTKMQIRYRCGRLVQHRRMLLAIGIL